MDSDAFGSCISKFLTTIEFKVRLPATFEILNPYTNEEVRRVVSEFCNKYYDDRVQRIPIWGINPGRYGSGVTGLSFTDPSALVNQLGIPTSLQGRRELSAEFIGLVLEAFGGPDKFYRYFYLSALSPVGFVKDGKNINFYDDAVLKKEIIEFIIKSITKQSACGLSTESAIVLGKGVLKQFFEKNIRSRIGYREVHFLEHPRFIMQYRRQKLKEYVAMYVEILARFA